MFEEVQRIIRNLLNVIQKKGFTFADPENIMSELTFQIMVKDDKKVLRNYSGRSRLTTYLWSVVRNRIINAMNREKPFVSVEGIENQYPQSSMPQESLLEALVEEHLAAEAPLERFIKYAKWLKDYNYQEIINQAKLFFSIPSQLNIQRIAYVLGKNRKDLQKKLKKHGYNV